MNTLAQEFAEFYAQTYPEGIGPNQKRQIMIAFVWGSASCLANVAAAADTEPKDVAAKYARDLLIEARGFFQHISAKTTDTPQQ